MRDRYLMVTYREGRPQRAYFRLPGEPGVRSARSEPGGEGVVVEIDADGRPIGLVITRPSEVSVEEVSEVLERLGLPPTSPEELYPISTAWGDPPALASGTFRLGVPWISHAHSEARRRLDPAHPRRLE